MHAVEDRPGRCKAWGRVPSGRGAPTWRRHARGARGKEAAACDACMQLVRQPCCGPTHAGRHPAGQPPILTLACPPGPPAQAAVPWGRRAWQAAARQRPLPRVRLAAEPPRANVLRHVRALRRPPARRRQAAGGSDVSGSVRAVNWQRRQTATGNRPRRDTSARQAASSAVLQRGCARASCTHMCVCMCAV